EQKEQKPASLVQLSSTLPQVSVSEINHMLLPELKQLAKEYHIPGVYKLKKAEIVALLIEMFTK
ncbi:50S ribosomal protein L20P, partial CDS, partial [Candidatus Phytoplasma solani]